MKLLAICEYDVTPLESLLMMVFSMAAKMFSLASCGVLFVCIRCFPILIDVDNQQ